MKIIKKLKDSNFLYEINNVIQNILVNNIDLYTKIKGILRIPDLTYDSLLAKDKVIIGDYVTNEILINPNLIQQINEIRNERGQSLLYILCSFKLDQTILYVIVVVGLNKLQLTALNNPDGTDTISFPFK